MELFFLRHGPAEPKDDWTGDDEERPHSAAGELLVSEVAATLARQHVAPDLIHTSQ
jgi:phosphohistidine phosphatase SixA